MDSLAETNSVADLFPLGGGRRLGGEIVADARNPLDARQDAVDHFLQCHKRQMLAWHGGHTSHEIIRDKGPDRDAPPSRLAKIGRLQHKHNSKTGSSLAQQ